MNETVVRELIREWLIEAADAEAAGESAADAFSASSIESLADELESQIEKAEEKIDAKTESLRRGRRRINEEIGVAFVLGGLLALPTLIKWFGKAVAAIIKGYAKAAKALGAESHSKSAEAKATSVEAFALKLYEKGHHAIQSLFQGFVKAFLIGSAAMAGPDSAAGMKEWLGTQEGQQCVEKTALALEFAVNCVLAYLSGVGAYHAFKEAHSAIAGAETVLTAAKASHIGEAVAAAAVIAGEALAKGVTESGIAAAAASKASENWAQVKNILVKVAENAKDLFSNDDTAGAAPAPA